MTKDDFYRGKTIVAVDWYLHDCDLPRLTWARRRTLDDGTADASFEEGGTLFGFENPEYASYILTEDEYRRFAGMDSDDEAEFGIRLADITPPTWRDRKDQEFEYLGTY